MILHHHYRIIKKYQLMVKMELMMKEIDGKWFAQVEMIIGWEKMELDYNMSLLESKLGCTDE